MCTIGLAIAGVSAVAGLAGGYQQMQAANYNAAVSEQQATASRQAASADEQRERTLSLRRLGGQRAAIGASGVTIEGTPGDVMADQARELELDALLIRYGGEREHRYYRSQAQQDRAAGRSAMIGGIVGAGTSLLSGWSGGGFGAGSGPKLYQPAGAPYGVPLPGRKPL